MAENSSPRVALVLAGGAARGAYEVGVVDHILTEVARDVGRDPRVDILCGTSVGAINACALAAFADLPPGERAYRLVRQWLGLRIGHVIRIDSAEVFATVRGLFGGSGSRARRGGLLDPTGLQRIVAAGIPFAHIADNIARGYLSAVTVSTTHIASGKTIVYIERRGGGAPAWGRDPTIVARPATITAVHALASAAIPLVFPAVMVDGEWHCDGGLRQNVPLSPARRLGADAMIVISPKFESRDAPAAVAAADLKADKDPAGGQAFPSPFFLLGKTLNALLLDRIDNDIDRLQRITALLEAGSRLYGPDFVDRVNHEMSSHAKIAHLRVPHAVKPIHAVLIRASQNISALAVDFVRTPAFASRASGVVGALLRRMASEGNNESDLLSYLLFDGDFARQLMDVGRADARAHHEELCAFFTRHAAAEAV